VFRGRTREYWGSSKLALTTIFFIFTKTGEVIQRLGMDLHQIQGHKRRSDTEELSEIYSASERKKGSRAPWTSQDMMSAMLLVKQGMSITKAAQSLNIPRTTLRDRVTGKVRSTRKLAANSSLTSQDERTLTDYYKTMRKQGYGRAKEMIIHMASKALKKSENVAGDHLLDSKWWQSFCARNNQPHSPGIDDSRISLRQQMNEIMLKNCSQQLFDVLTNNKHGINFLDHPELIFSCNENVFDLEVTSKQLLNIKEAITKVKEDAEENVNSDVGGQRDQEVDGKISVSLVDDDKIKHLFESQGKGKPLKSSVITCVNASGHVLQPFFIHSPQNGDLPFGSYEHYVQERLDEDFFLLWFHEVFLRNPARRGPCILIYDGQNCLVTREMLMAASVNEVIMFCIPANCTSVLQPVDMSTDGVFADTWRDILKNRDIDHELVHHSFKRIFQDVWLNVATEAVITDRFKLVGIFPFSRHTSTPKNLDFESDEFGHERFGAFLGPDSDINLQTRKKDSPLALIMRNQRGSQDQQIDGNQNFARPAGRITRPTMSILNQPLNDVPMIPQIIGEEDEFHEDFPEISNSADEFSSCSDDGGTSMVALSSGITSLPSLVSYKSATESVSYSPNDHVTSPKMAAQKRHHIPKVTDSSLHERQTFSSAGPIRTMVPQYQRVIHSVPGSLPRKRPITAFSDMRPSAVTCHSISIRHPPPHDVRSEGFTRVGSDPAELHAFEDILDQGRKSKFQKAFDEGLVYTEDNDPLYPLWRSLKFKYLDTSTVRNNGSHISCEVSQVSPSVIEITPKTTRTPTSEAHQIPAKPPNNCPCSENLRTILTPAGNVSVSRNATVIVIMPEKQDSENSLTTIDSNGTGVEQGSRASST